MKTTIRIPTVQYGYIEIETEVESQVEAIELHNDMIAVYKTTIPKADLKDDDF